MEAAPALTRLADNICKFHQRGHCKFGDTCRHLHTHITCTTPQCSESCGARHPRPCNYFARFGSCKFGTSCSYLHSEHTTHIEITNMKETIQQVLNVLQAKEKEITKLEEKINLLEKTVNSMSAETFNCDLCPYKCASSTSLKTHTTKKHKPEQLRHTSTTQDLNMSLNTPDRNESLPHSEYEDTTNITPFTPCTPFKCEHCEFEATNKIKLLRHTAVTHDPGVPHTTFWDPNKCYMCTKSFDKTEAFKDHMVGQHSYTLDCDECDECGETSTIGEFSADQDSKSIGMFCISCASNGPEW
jgi:hypothetical protein